jgi:hypothetical protein
MWHSVQRRHFGGTDVPFKVVEMVGKYLKLPAGNNECGFYVIWAMLCYIGRKSDDADKLVCIIPISFMSLIIQHNDLLIPLWIPSFLNDSARNMYTKGC